MKIAVLGMWHLGTVTAACLAGVGFEVIGFDEDEAVIQALQTGRPPVDEPGLKELIGRGLEAGKLKFSRDPQSLAGAAVVWAAYDTPVDEEDRADTESVIGKVTALFPHMSDHTLVIVSSQLPIGSTGRLEQACRQARSEAGLSFACLPENLRLGKAIEVFTRPDRVVAGVRTEKDRIRVAGLLKSFTENIIWMSVESAEMTKHALNVFLAASVAYINEVASIAEHYGADASEVEKGLKSDQRIGPGAYLRAGGPFAGGTLARDIGYLKFLGAQKAVPTPLISGVQASNDEHKNWSRRRLSQILGGLEGRTVAIWGLTYKPGTDTLRRSEAVELCRWLGQQGARIQAFDPAVKDLPSGLENVIRLQASAEEALAGAQALVIATEWPEFKNFSPDDLLGRMAKPLVLDPGRFLAAGLAGDKRITYLNVGKPI